MVHDLKVSNPGKWYSKVKRMTGQDNKNSSNLSVDELKGISDTDQAENIVEFYSSTEDILISPEKNP